jgi:hypothetical protein
MSNTFRIALTVDLRLAGSPFSAGCVYSAMKKRTFLLLAAGELLVAGAAQAQPRWRYWDFGLDGGRNAERCSDLKPHASGNLAQATENFTISKSGASTLQISARNRAQIRVRGTDRSDYGVEVCKFAVAGSQSAADQALREITVTRNGGTVGASGPSDRDAPWQVVFFVQAPKDASLDLESTNSPVAVSNVNGKLTVRSTNGPVSLDRVSGTVDAETNNGPIAMTAGSGEVRLHANNGPIALNLPDREWKGSLLEARTNNGPLSVSAPTGFRTGIRVETSGHVPISCGLDACQTARTEGRRFFPQTMQINGTSDVIRLSTHNGPVSVGGRERRARII